MARTGLRHEQLRKYCYELSLVVELEADGQVTRDGGVERRAQAKQVGQGCPTGMFFQTPCGSSVGFAAALRAMADAEDVASSVGELQLARRLVAGSFMAVESIR